ncbi:sodium:proton antiporter NhaD [Pseudemcibacter aquimaris]|uniref:sodium:proton antiporter NhaD n=1 Tax=Pseudemcibacter aquimaris TaxID=2857064 RepID=UPI0020130A36|nr:sodium:proton antiporter NhaD [Pseudemcibacter aquimaris]MCC3862412.1 sodium:proton antiporter NhaD [Pseudemcibacter aquimaris]WDU59158.1 sodium:proton antiporter NhaD [Pseudemcibacter aquimaris]
MDSTIMDLTSHWVGITAIVIFVLSYSLVIAEEYLHLKKSIPVIFGAGLIWLIVAVQYVGDPNHQTEEAIKHLLIEFGELFLFLLAAMTYVNAMNERGVFDSLRVWLVHHKFSYRQLFWVTGVMSFFLSPIIDNLTTALVMCAVIMAVGRDNNNFIAIGFVNIVIAANAGGAFSPFGDITTLMVWQTGVVDFWTFFNLFLPSVVNYIIPAFFMSLAVSKEVPAVEEEEEVVMLRGARRIMLLFGLTIVTAVSFHSFLHIPPFLGMMVGLAYLKAFGHYLRITHQDFIANSPGEDMGVGEIGDTRKFDSFREIARAEWDTLLFFFGVIMCVGGLGFIGYLALASNLMYVEMGPTFANIMVGILSAIVDNIPVMVAVLQMDLTMDIQQWLLVTLTAGVGGSMLSIGSAAGIALMGQSQGKYTFFGHLKWTPVIAIGYAASIWVHMMISDRFIGVMP